MSMTLGKLVDMIAELKREEDELAAAHRALLHGGSHQTMVQKKVTVEWRQSEVERLRAQVLEL